MKILILSFFLCLAIDANANSMNGKYLCKKGFLGFTKIDSLAISTMRDGSLHIKRETADFIITKDCKVLNQEELSARCDSTSGRVTLTEKTMENHSEVTSTLSFEEIRGLIVVKEGKKFIDSNQEVILVCRAI